MGSEGETLAARRARSFERGLHEVGDGLYAYLQPDGSWGWSNSGLIIAGGESLLVDTLFDLRLTREMLDDMRRAVPAAARIGTLVNTHANGDHCWGNQLVRGARIVASRRTAEEMLEVPPGMIQALVEHPAGLGPSGGFFARCFGAFDFRGIVLTPPTETFDEHFQLRIGDREVRLLEVGPAHTRGDTLVLLPRERVLYSGDILFNGAHPIAWAGPVSNWLRAYDEILAMDIDVIVPGHGPLADKHAVREQRDYFTYLIEQARPRLDAGMTPLEAAREIALDRWAAWGEHERVVVNLATIFRELAGEDGPVDPLAAWADMAAYSAD
jgi:glyoxylase-like metal-dependent hydrolase (beta-lactamase superfamily II)